MTTPQQQIYNPYRLIEEVTELLRDRGLDPYIAPGNAGDALGGAGLLLRALGIAPLMEAEEAFQTSAAKVWSDADGLRKEN